MRSDFCKPDWNHLWEEVWTDVSESEQVQTLISDLTVRDVSLRLYATSLSATQDSLTLIKLLLLADINGGNGGNGGHWKHQSLDRGRNQIFNLWGDGSVQAKLKGLLLLSQLYDITQNTIDDASTPTTLPQQPVRLVINVAQSDQSQIWFGHLLKTAWTVRPKNQIWEGIRFACSVNAAYVL